MYRRVERSHEQQWCGVRGTRERQALETAAKKITNARERGIFIVAAIPSYRMLYIYNVVAAHTLPAFGDKYFEFIFRFLHEQRVQHVAVCVCVGRIEWEFLLSAEMFAEHGILPSRIAHNTIPSLHAREPPECVCVCALCARETVRASIYIARGIASLR